MTQESVLKGPKDPRERENSSCQCLGRCCTHWGSNPLPLGSRPATSPTGPGRTPSSSGGGHLDPPGAPGAEVSLCGGVRDPLGPHYHLRPFVVMVWDPPWVLTTTTPLCSGVAGPLWASRAVSPLCDGVGGLHPPETHLSLTSGCPSSLLLPSRVCGDRFPPPPSLWEASCTENDR